MPLIRRMRWKFIYPHKVEVGLYNNPARKDSELDKTNLIAVEIEDEVGNVIASCDAKEFVAIKWWMVSLGDPRFFDTGKPLPNANVAMSLMTKTKEYKCTIDGKCLVREVKNK